MPTKSVDEQILERLDLILKVLSLGVAVGQSSTERARLLKLAGLDNVTIARLLGTSPNTIRALLSNSRDRAKTKK